MKQVNIMLKPASSACNLRCKYCFYADLAGKRDTFCFGSMSDETAGQILHNIRRDLQEGDSVTFAFQGGEPTLVGLEWYERFAAKAQDILKGLSIQYVLQTNGTKLDEAWAKFLYDHHFLVGLSLDGMAKCHNACRLDINGNGTYSLVMDAMHLLEKHHVEFNILCTLTSDIARHPNQIWNWICKNDIQYIQFTPCLDGLDASGKSPYALHPRKFASFYIRMFELWSQDFAKGKYRSIKLFDDVVNLLAFGIPTGCGIHGKCQCQLVVEADGSTYPCDFYCIDSYRLGNLREDSFVEMIESDTTRGFLNRPREDMRACQTCRYQRFCGGGCRRMQREIYCAPGDSYCGYREFLDASMPVFQQIAMQQRKYRQASRAF